VQEDDTVGRRGNRLRRVHSYTKKERKEKKEKPISHAYIPSGVNTISTICTLAHTQREGAMPFSRKVWHPLIINWLIGMKNCTSIYLANFLLSVSLGTTLRTWCGP